ncbi:unnamed protein product [Phytophthora fragariaefolia]|uniref:Unnamed protein product n=1 Tax=Phytophthora fragariaefolia TaxID=1490495 RepID=A0A9W6Y9V6_9STRA|nr:unnamed protein product [Phytophthora fragariaefolia]
MQVLGYSTDELLVRARGAQQDWQLGEHAEAEPDQEADKVTGGVPTSFGCVCRLQAAALNPPVGPCDTEVERHESRPATSTMARLREAQQPRLREILYVYLDTFRLGFGNDPPVKVAPLQVRIKSGAVPTKAYMRQAPPLDREFLERHVGKLLASGLVCCNPRSRWASAPRIIRKKEQGTDPTADPRMAIDTRSRLKALPFSSVWIGSGVPIGAKDSVAYCQAIVEEIFGDLIGNGIYCWLDDIPGDAKDAESLMVLLDQVLERCEKYGLKLHATKCRFYATQIQWCGKKISANGVRHCPDRIQGLGDMPMPRTAADLQQFLCAENWM